MRVPRRLPRAVLLALVFLVACGKDATSPGTSVAGTYVMQTVNGGPLPATTAEVTGAYRVEVLSGTFVLRGDNSYTETINIRTTYSIGTTQNEALVEDGHYVVNGQTILLTIPANATGPVFSYEGTLSANALSYVYQANAFVYRR